MATIVTELSLPSCTCINLWPGCCMMALSTMPASEQDLAHIPLSIIMQCATCTLCAMHAQGTWPPSAVYSASSHSCGQACYPAQQLSLVPVSEGGHIHVATTPFASALNTTSVLTAPAQQLPLPLPSMSTSPRSQRFCSSAVALGMLSTVPSPCCCAAEICTKVAAGAILHLVCSQPLYMGCIHTSCQRLSRVGLKQKPMGPL